MARRGEVSRYDMTDEAFVYLFSRLPFLIQRTSQILTALFNAHPGGLSVTLPQFQLLDLLARRGASSQIDLARKAGIDAATTGLILGNLVRSGRVERRVDTDDTRRKIVAITDEGRSALAIATDRNRRLDRSIAERLGDDARLLVRLLERLLQGQAGSRPADAVLNRCGDEVAADRTPTLDLAPKLRRCLQISERKLTDAVGPLDLTMRQFAVLYAMLVIPGLTKSDFVRLLGYEKSNAALVMRILHGKALIEPVNDAPRRRYQITAAGVELLVTSHLRVVEAEQSLSAGLGDTDTALLQCLLGSVIRQFDGDMRQPIPTFVTVKSQPGWPMSAAPGPSFLVKLRTGGSIALAERPAPPP